MQRNLLLSMLVAAIGLAGMVALMTATPAYSQDDMVQIAIEELGNERPPSVFVHDEHNEKAEIEECYLCHHEDGANPDPDASSEGTPCMDCHEVAPAEGTALMDAYHTQCKGCHVERGKGPVACGECHVRK